MTQNPCLVVLLFCRIDGLPIPATPRHELNVRLISPRLKISRLQRRVRRAQEQLPQISKTVLNMVLALFVGERRVGERPVEDVDAMELVEHCHGEHARIGTKADEATRPVCSLEHRPVGFVGTMRRVAFAFAESHFNWRMIGLVPHRIVVADIRCRFVSDVR